jgi:hypothetical protein
MKSTKVIRKPQGKLASQVMGPAPKNEQTITGRKSLRPMKSMMGVKSLRPSSSADQYLKRRTK